MWYLIGLVLLALVTGIIWVYKYKKAKRDAARKRQFELMFSQLTRDHAAASTAPPVAIQTAALFARKQRLLTPGDGLLYYVLRAGLTDHEIFAHVPLSDIVEVTATGYDAEQKKKQLALVRADFVICNKQFEIIAAVVVKEDAAVERGLIGECLRGAGIRLVRIDPALPPKHTQVRALIYGVS